MISWFNLWFVALTTCQPLLGYLMPNQYPLEKYKVKLATLVKGDPKAPFSIATTPSCRGGRYSFPWIAPLYPWYVTYNAECWARRHLVPFLKSLVWLDLGLNLGLPDHWKTLYSFGQWPGLERYKSPYLSSYGLHRGALAFTKLIFN